MTDEVTTPKVDAEDDAPKTPETPVEPKPVEPPKQTPKAPAAKKKAPAYKNAPKKLQRQPVPPPKPSSQNMRDTLQALDCMKKDATRLVNLGVDLPTSLVKNINTLWAAARSDLGME